MGIRISDVAGIQMIRTCWVIEWSSFRMPSENRMFFPVFEWFRYLNVWFSDSNCIQVKTIKRWFKSNSWRNLVQEKNDFVICIPSVLSPSNICDWKKWNLVKLWIMIEIEKCKTCVISQNICFKFVIDSYNYWFFLLSNYFWCG